MNIPTITNLDTALRIYYSNSELDNKSIIELFGQRISSATISKLKKVVKDEMSRQNIMSYGLNRINTALAYETWGIDVVDLEKRRKKLKDLNLQ
ncbi:MAG: hypothetical protein LBC73_09080 [Oscillospiraceae bacterium]|jgi:hypothetical protein|nr:hypothetical protein [Oscillospiraceae bacterium]